MQSLQVNNMKKNNCVRCGFRDFAQDNISVSNQKVVYYYQFTFDLNQPRVCVMLGAGKCWSH